MSPNQEFGEDYNRLRAAVAALYPPLVPLLPPEVVIEKGQEYGRGFTRSRYSEIDAYCEQILQLMNEQQDTE